MDILTYIIAIAGGFLAGIVNTLAGNGSAITLSIFTELFGLPGNIANGTNRVGILFQGFSSSYGFIRNGRFNNIPYTWLYILVATVGAIMGVLVALSVTNEQFMQVFRYLLLVTLLVLLVNPKRWLIKTDITRVPNLWIYTIVVVYLFHRNGFIEWKLGLTVAIGQSVGGIFFLKSTKFRISIFDIGIRNMSNIAGI